MARKPAELTVNREDILLAAAQVFYERGYHRAKMEDIARVVDLTAGSLYHHFPAGKEEILLAVLTAGLDEVSRRIENSLQSVQNPAEKLRIAIHQHILGVTENVSVGAAMVFEIRALLDTPEVREAYVIRRDKFEKLFRSIIQEGVDQGVFHTDDVKLFVRMMLGAQNWVGVWYHPDGALSGEAIADHTANWVLNALQYQAPQSEK